MIEVIELARFIRRNPTSISLQSTIAGHMLNASHAELRELYEEEKRLRLRQANILARIKELESVIEKEDKP